MIKTKTRKNGSVLSKMLRLLGIDGGFREPTNGRKKIVHASVPGINNYSYEKEIEAACLEAERKKAEALMSGQRHRLIC